MKNLYAKFVFWLIKPALNLKATHKVEIRSDGKRLADVITDDLRQRGAHHQAIEKTLYPSGKNKSPEEAEQLAAGDVKSARINNLSVNKITCRGQS